MFKGKKIIVTGSSGFVGSYLVSRLEFEGAKVIGLDIANGVNITNWETIQEIRDFDIIYHLASINFVPLSYKNPRKTYHTNIVATLNMLELCRQNNAKMIFASSYVYGEPKYLPINEEHPLMAVNPYAQSKIIGEEICRGYNRDHGVNVIILRPFNIYGKRQNAEFLIPTIIRQSSLGSIKLKDPDPKRDFVHISDVIEAYIKAAGYGKSGFEVFNIGFGISYSVKEIVEMILSHIPKYIEVNFSGERRKNEILDTIADIGKAKKMLDWKPQISLSEGLKNLM